ncbi:MAG TPA: bifunctional metallophosphatase/5'-nucleotidase [Polyangiaceae bacterium]
MTSCPDSARPVLTGWLGALLLATASSALGCSGASETRRAERTAHGPASSGKPVRVKLLGLNDFHGQLSPRTLDGRPVGGAAVLASYLKAASAGREERTFLVHAGDLAGASPPNSALLQDEPSVSFLNTLADDRCSSRRDGNKECNVIAALGNHEFDEGRSELFRLIDGGNHPKGPFLDPAWRGARYPYVCANVVETKTGRSILPSAALRWVDGVPIAFIGAVLRETPTIVMPAGVEGLEFRDEADAINATVAELRASGVHAFVVAIHQGTDQTSYAGPTDAAAPLASGALSAIVSRLDDDIDVIVAGHTHAFTNALLPNARGVPILVTQAFSASTAYADIDLVLDDKTRNVVSKTATIVRTWADQGPGLTPDAKVAAIVAAADARVAPFVERVVGHARTDITRAPNAAGESALGNLVADAQRASIGADFALTNPGGIRADLASGEISWGELFTVQPFGNTVVALTLTGRRIYDLLNQQWGAPQPPGGRILQISGLSYTWNPAIPEGGQRVVEVRDASGKPLEPDRSYRIAVNSFIAGGGDNFTVLRSAGERSNGPSDLDAFGNYLTSLKQPFTAAITGRITQR